MASSSASFAHQQPPARSISLPSRLQHPNTTKIVDELNRLRTFEISALSAATPVRVESLETNLVGLAELYNCVQELLQSPTTQRSLLQHQGGTIVEEALEESVVLLDSCSNIQNLFLMIKEHVQSLQSAMRRKSGDSSLESDIASYLSFRKKMKKDVAKSLRTLKHMENRTGHPPLFDLDHHLSMAIRVLREVTTVTISVLRAALLFLSWPASKAKSSKWSLISKLMLSKSAVQEKGQVISDAGSVDIALSSLHSHFRNNDAKSSLQTAHRRLQMFDSSITSLETALECMFRQLVQHRVSLLNILTQ